MTEARLFIDEPVGERRRLLVDKNDRAIRLDIERAGERLTRARVGEIWTARLIEPTPEGDWRIDLGNAVEARLRKRRQSNLASGSIIPVRVITEARQDKTAIVEPSEGQAQTTLGRIQTPEEDSFLRGITITRTISDAPARTAIDAAIEEATTSAVAFSGARLWIQPTRALTAIDLDRGASRLSSVDLNLAGAREAARQIALRGIGGLVLIDFIGAPRGAGGKQLSTEFTASLQNYAALRADSLGLSRFGLLQVAIPRGRRDLASALACPPAEREALDALRELETLGIQNRSARLSAELSTEAERSLRTNLPDWEAQLADRIGPRARINATERPLGNPVIKALS